ncbi:uncharacterized protein BXZ73DRAFT_107729 [Epithele typhae]|uniref:uncharacterized protein n=1 Tax=Epithele typhae TaxID=378194 RepID=UPI00200728E0|nr:uncharacterized protein BXZ73DRAFT_107729 [Epithele typhae]KAH9911961.1 hypothetical protein BXZ73DRAFT_107729 [Epithele typhae]
MDMEVALVCEAIQNGLGGHIKMKKNNGGSLTFPHDCCRLGRKLIEALGLDNIQGGFNLQKWNRICTRNWVHPL